MLKKQNDQYQGTMLGIVEVYPNASVRVCVLNTGRSFFIDLLGAKGYYDAWM